MTEAERKFAILASLVMTLSVGINLVALQERGGRRTPAGSPEVAGAIVPPTPRQAISAAAPGAAAQGPAPSVSAPPPPNMAEVTRSVQRELNARSYEAGPPDGVAGLVTRAAIMAYEHDYGLPLTARPSEDLLSRIVLGSSVPPSAPAPADARLTPEADQLVRTVKQLLAALGYAPGAADGAITAQLRRTIREFEIAQKLPESARVSGPLVSRLVRLQAARTAAAAKSKARNP